VTTLGGKGGSTAPAVSPADNSMEMMMMQMMMGMMGSNNASDTPEQPVAPIIPEVTETEDIDWKAKHDELAAKMEAEYDAELEGAKGTEDTVHTSPLLDEEDTTDQSIIAGTVPDAHLPTVLTDEDA
jgi:hypothetical protein